MRICKATICFMFLAILCAPAMADAASVTLRWQANQEPDISGYNVYYGTSSRSYGAPIPVGNTTSHTIDNLAEGTTYYFALTATDTSGNESGFSSEVSANATSSEPATTPYRLLISTRSDRSNAESLSGQTISGDVYIFLDPEAYVSQAVFSIDGQTHNTENYAPYDLGTPFDSSTLSNGSHTISALVRLQDGSTTTLSDNISVLNESSPAPPTVSAAPESVVMQPSVSSPQTVGSVVTIDAVVTGGSGDLEYQFFHRGPATGNVYRVVQPYSANSSWQWDTAGDAGANDIVVYVRRAGVTAKTEVWSQIQGYVIK